MVVVVYENLYKKYTSYGNICALIVWLFAWILILVIPFLIAFFTESKKISKKNLFYIDFWLTQNTYIEKPYVTYKQEAIIMIESNQPGNEKIWTSNKHVNSLIPLSKRMNYPTIKVKYIIYFNQKRFRSIQKLVTK